MSSPRFVPYQSHHDYPADEMRQRALSFYEQMRQRRTVRQFSNRPVPRATLCDLFVFVMNSFIEDPNHTTRKH